MRGEKQEPLDKEKPSQILEEYGTKNCF